MRASCPACGARLPRVVYGLPDAEISAAAERGDIVLAGCDPGDPVTLRCRRCGRTVELPSELPSGAGDDGPGGHAEAPI